jgi:hypothetical protein
VTFDTVIYAEDEKAAKQVVKYGTGEINDMPVSVLAMPIESRDGLPAGWNTGCLTLAFSVSTCSITVQ